MKNTLRFLIVALLGLSSTYAQAYFCVKEEVDLFGHARYTLTQKKEKAAGEDCFSVWSDPYEGVGVPELLNAKLSNSEQKSLVIGSDIDFGGINAFSSSSTWTVCTEEFTPLGDAVYLNFFADTNLATGKPYVIKNFCYAHDDVSDGGEFNNGFFNSLSYSDVHEIIFENAAVIAQNKNTAKLSPVNEGVLAGVLMGTTVQSVVIDGAVVHGARAGTLAGKIDQSTIHDVSINDARVCMKSDVMSGSSFYGYYSLGGVAGDLSSSEITRAMISNLIIVDSLNTALKSDPSDSFFSKGYLGGIAGTVDLASIEGCGVKSGSIGSLVTEDDVVSQGYLVGMMDWGSSTDVGLFSNYYIGTDGIDHAVGALFVNGILNDSYSEISGMVNVGGKDVYFMKGDFRSSFEGCSSAERSNNNGCLLADSMKMASFASRLRDSLFSSQKWSVDVDGYPIPATADNPEARRITFKIRKLFVQSQSVADKLLNVFTADNFDYYYQVYVYTGYGGKLPEDWIEFATDLASKEVNGEKIEWVSSHNISNSRFTIKENLTKELSSDQITMDFCTYNVEYLIEQIGENGDTSYINLKDIDDAHTSYIFNMEPVTRIDRLDSTTLFPMIVAKTVDENGDVVKTENFGISQFFFGEDVHQVNRHVGNGAPYLVEGGNDAGLLMLVDSIQFKGNFWTTDSNSVSNTFLLMMTHRDGNKFYQNGLLANDGPTDDGEMIKVSAYGKSIGSDADVLMGSISFDNADVSNPETVPVTEKMQVQATLPGYKASSWDALVCVNCQDAASWPNEMPYEVTDDVLKALTNPGVGAIAPQTSFVFRLDVDEDGFFSLKKLMEAFVPERSGGGANPVAPTSWSFKFKPNMDLKSFYVAFDSNTTAEVFYANNSSKNFFTLLQLGDDLPKLYRGDGYCFEGWSTSLNGDAYSSVQINMLDDFVDDEINTLYAQWTKDSDCEGDDLILHMSGKGSVRLYQIYNENGSTRRVYHDFEQGDEENTFVVRLPGLKSNPTVSAPTFALGFTVTPDDEYFVNKLSLRNDPNTEFNSFDYLYNTYSYSVGDYLELKMSFVKETGHEVVYDLGAGKAGSPKDPNSFFYATTNNSYEIEWNPSLSLNSTLPFVYSSEGFMTQCWFLDGDENMESRYEYDMELLDASEEYNSNKLNAYWINLSEIEMPRFNISGESEHGSVSLIQVVNGDTLSRAITKDGLDLVRAENGTAYTFFMRTAPDEGYGIAGDVVLTDGNGETYTFYPNDIITISRDFYEFGDITITAEFAPKKRIELSLGNVDKDTVFFDERWKDSIEVVQSQNSYDMVEFPQYVYSTHSCVIGWSAYPDSYVLPDYSNGFDMRPAILKRGAQNEEPFFWEASNGEVLRALENADEEILYAIWGDAEQCMNGQYGYARFELSQKTDVVLREVLEYDDGKKDTVDHPFGKDGTLLFPAMNQDRFSFHGDSTFEKAEFTNWDNELVVFKEGESLKDVTEGSFAVTIYGGSANIDPDGSDKPFVFEKHDIWQSGNMLFADLTIPDSLKGEFFEVFVTIENDSEVVAERPLSLQEDFGGDKVFGPFPAGNYYLKAFVYPNEDDKPAFEQKFTVTNVIADGCEGCWHMVALDNVDFDEIDLNDDDIQMFWWNEATNFGSFWQYHRFYANSAVERGQGYWYSSLEGRPLVLRESADIGEKDEPYDEPHDGQGVQPADPVVWAMDSLNSGWNMVSNPYSWDVDLYGGNDDENMAFYRWNPGTSEYEQVSVIGANESVWAHVSEKTEWILSETPAFVYKLDSTGKKQPLETDEDKKSLEKSANVYGWSLQAVLTDGNGKKDSWNFVGVADNAKNVEEPPAGMGNRVTLSIVENNRALTKSYRKAETAGAYEWTLEASATSARMGNLSFAGVRLLNSMGLAVYATIDGKTTEMREGESVRVPLSKNAKKIDLYVATAPKPNFAATIANTRALRVGDGLVVNFEASEVLAGAKAQVEIISTRGEVVASASLKTGAGFNRLNMALPKPGVYMVRIRVKNTISAAKFITR